MLHESDYDELETAMKKVIIIGGGLVGSLLAILLAKRGWQVVVYEKRPDIRKKKLATHRSINLVIAYRGWKALRLAGIEEQIKPLTVAVYGRMTHDLQGNTQFIPYDEVNHQAIYSVSRASLNAKLIEIASQSGNVKFFFEHPCKDIDFRGGKVWVTNNSTGETREDQADMILGADGANSAVRLKMMTTERQSYSQQYIEHCYKEIVFPLNEKRESPFQKDALHIWPRKNFMLMNLANPDGTFTGTLFMHHTGPDSFETIKTPADVRKFFTTHFPDALPHIPNLEEEYFSHPESNLMIVRCDPWVFGKTALIGDAAHAIVPFYGEGMNCGFEDCQVLCELIDQYESQLSVEEILQKYYQKRKPSGDAIADLSMMNFVEMRDRVADPVFLLRKKIETKMHAKYPEQWTPLYSQVKFTDIPYEKALATGILQEEILTEVMQIPQIEQKWDSPEVEQLILHKWNEKKA